VAESDEALALFRGNLVRNWPEADELDDTIGRQVSRVQRTYWPTSPQGQSYR
jgi:hypothetical protein